MREVVLRIIFAMYKEHREAVLEFLPPSDSGARRTMRYKTLFEGFAKIDRKSPETGMRVCHERAERTGPLQTRLLAEWCPDLVAGLDTAQVAGCAQVCGQCSLV